MPTNEHSLFDVTRDTFGVDALARPGVERSPSVCRLITNNIMPKQEQGFYIAWNKLGIAAGGLVAFHRYTDGKARVVGIVGSADVQTALIERFIRDSRCFAAGVIVPTDELLPDALTQISGLQGAQQAEVLGHHSLVLAFRG